MDVRRCIQRGAAALAVALALMTSMSSSAASNDSASSGRQHSTSSTIAVATSVSECTSKGEGHKARWYYPRSPWQPAPLRCGNQAWGLRHLAGRWNAWFEDMIQITMSSPTRAGPSGGAIRFELDITDCPVPYTFRVVVDYNPRNDGQPRGIITAYDVPL